MKYIHYVDHAAHVRTLVAQDLKELGVKADVSKSELPRIKKSRSKEDSIVRLSCLYVLVF